VGWSVYLQDKEKLHLPTRNDELSHDLWYVLWDNFGYRSLLYSGFRQRPEDVPNSVDLVAARFTIQLGHLRLRRDSQVEPQEISRRLARERNLLLEHRKHGQQLGVLCRLHQECTRVAAALRRYAMWWRAKHGLLFLPRIIWFAVVPCCSKPRITISFILHNAYVNNNINKWITNIIPMRWGDVFLISR